MEEVIVLADQDKFAFGRVAPDLGVGSLGKAYVDYMQAFTASRGKETGQRGGKLVIDEESHVASRTGWSA